MNLKFDEEPKYEAYIRLFEGLCGPRSQRPIQTLNVVQKVGTKRPRDPNDEIFLDSTGAPKKKVRACCPMPVLCVTVPWRLVQRLHFVVPGGCSIVRVNLCEAARLWLPHPLCGKTVACVYQSCQIDSKQFQRINVVFWQPWPHHCSIVLTQHGSDSSGCHSKAALSSHHRSVRNTFTDHTDWSGNHGADLVLTIGYVVTGSGVL